MPRKTPNALEKLIDLEAKKEDLIKLRQQELLNLIIKYNALIIDDQLLAGFLLFTANLDNKNHPILKEFKELASRSKIPSKPKQQSQKRAKKDH